MVDYPVDESSIVKIVRIDVVTVDFVVEVECLRIDGTAVTAFYCSDSMLIFKRIIGFPPPN